jgi:copper resistance protein B
MSAAIGVFLLAALAPMPAQAGAQDHSQHQVPKPPLPPFIPAVTDEMRKAAFPDVDGHAAHDNAVHSYVLFDQFEWHAGDGHEGLLWDTKGWIGRDVDRLWFRTEGRAEDGQLDDAQAHVLYGRAVSRWWDLVAGVRQDVRPGPQATWAAIGVQGLAPYWFEIEATAYVGASGRTHFRFEGEYDLLLTNRLVLQPLLEVEVFGKSDPRRGIGRGVSTAEWGARLRYEVRREFAPYVGLTWDRKFFGTADAARARGDRTSGLRLAVGVRWWQ